MLDVAIKNPSDQQNMFGNQSIKSVYATGMLNKEIVEHYVNSIGKIIEHTGFSICSTNIENEQSKRFFELKKHRTLLMELQSAKERG